ncbi:unnamed protein product [Paramecium octaurelia]|uniref:Uncharacterized protein n=1 Tax=Paramecium octaurelia TaxID=43137 RepID=A0A8S1X3W7_PAROT|nr:unnamed protein product [Paramecium octaurelia]
MARVLRIFQGVRLFFQYFFQISTNLLCKGKYLNNTKIGRWKNYCYGAAIIKNMGGEYDENELKMDVGEPSVDYWVLHKIILAGTYKNGIKVGTWEIKKNNHKVGGGDYDDQGRKNGQWIDIQSNFDLSKIKFIQGEYINGKKNGEFKVRS